MNKNSNYKSRSPTKKKKYKGKFYSTQEYRTYWFARGYYARAMVGSNPNSPINSRLNYLVEKKESFKNGRDAEMVVDYNQHPLYKNKK